MSFTVDDADPSFAYSTGGWAVQSEDDPDLPEFFQETYHVATTDGATMTFQFSGSAFTLYGSKGPGHARFNLQYDDAVIDAVDASAPTTAFRQALFTHTFSTNVSAQHQVKVTAVLSGDGVQGNWLDLDYISFSSSAPGSGTTASTSSTETATVDPPWFTQSSTQSGASSTTSGPTSSTGSSSHSSSNKVPTILATLFGVIIGFAIIVLIIYLILRRIYERRRARERAFRYGQSSVNPSTVTGLNSSGASAKSGGVLDVVAGVFARPRSPQPPQRENAMTPYSQVGARDASLASNTVEMRSMSMDHRDREREREASTTPSTARPLMSASPIAWTRQKVGGGRRGDADSLRTDFLQV